MIDLNQNETPYSGDSKHEIDSLLNRGGWFGAVRDGFKGVFKYWFMKTIILLILVLIGIGQEHREKISSLFANYDIKGGVAAVMESDIKSKLLNKHWIYKTELANEYANSQEKSLRSVADYIEDEGDFLITKKVFDANIYDKTLFGWLFTDAKEDCEDKFLEESYPIKFDTNYYPDDFQEWDGKQKFRCVYQIGKKSSYTILKGKK